MHALLFLFVVTVVNVSCDVIHDGDGDCQESPWLCRQLAKMRRVMAEQQRVIQQQNDQIDQQSSVIVDLSSRVDQQSSVIVDLSSRVDQQSSVIVDLSSRVDQQSSVIVDLSSRVDQQSSMIVTQNKQIDKQNKQIDEQSSVNVQLNTSDAKQNTLIKKLQEELVTLKTQKHEKNGVDSVHETSVTSNDEQRDVASRSDDGGPLEVVVNQISQQLTTVSADVQALKNVDQVLQNANHQQDLNIQDARTSTFVHWGSTTCPSDAQLVYSGVVGGSLYSQTGGGSNYLCLTMSPVFSSHAIAGSEDSHIYGSEYQTFNDAHHDKDALCAVCRSSHSTTIMIPGTNVCTPGWTKQYDGFLMAAREAHSVAEFICVDSVMESRPGSDANQDGRLLYFTVTVCGSLPCGPYENNKVVTCVVCSM